MVEQAGILPPHITAKSGAEVQTPVSHALSTHTLMRPQPLEVTLERASRLWYTSIELAGEPDKYSFEKTHRLFAIYNMTCWGTVNHYVAISPDKLTVAIICDT